MNGPSRQRFAQLRVPPAIGGAALALAMLLSSGTAMHQSSAAPALFCAPVAANFGIFSDELEQERITLPQPAATCQTAPPAPQAVAGSVSATGSDSDRSNIYAQMMDLAVQQTAAGDDNVWLAAYQSMAYDRVE